MNPSVYSFTHSGNTLPAYSWPMDLEEEESIYRLALTLVPGIGGVLARNLLGYCGSAKKVFQTSKGKLLKIPDVGPRSIELLFAENYLKQAEAEIKFMSRAGIQALFFTEEEFPVRLKECADSPAILYRKGEADINAARILAIVGTRNATPYGKKMLAQIMEDLQDKDILILSGLAFGIDTLAHKMALEKGLKTAAVLGHGLQTIYPQQNKLLADQMCRQGGLLSEFSSQAPIVPGNFPRRNRIVAGMCDALLVVETGIKGGAVITANIANSYSRDVFAIPGSIGQRYSQGCNFMIKTHKAALIESAEDLLKAMCWDDQKVKAPRQTELMLELNEEERRLMDLLRKMDNADIDYLSRELKMTPGSMASLLIELEFKGILLSLPGKRFKAAHS